MRLSWHLQAVDMKLRITIFNYRLVLCISFVLNLLFPSVSNRNKPTESRSWWQNIIMWPDSKINTSLVRDALWWRQTIPVCRYWHAVASHSECRSLFFSTAVHHNALIIEIGYVRRSRTADNGMSTTIRLLFVWGCHRKLPTVQQRTTAHWGQLRQGSLKSVEPHILTKYR